MNRFYKTMKSPVGRLTLIATDVGLSAILWENDDPDRTKIASAREDNTHPILLKTELQLIEYFNKKRTTFSVELDAEGTEFQKSVWMALSTIPFGETRSYGQIAKQIKKPKAFRAVGAANGKNPISIIVPCHRVIGANGTLTGFAGGLTIKSKLLSLEKAALEDR